MTESQRRLLVAGALIAGLATLLVCMGLSVWLSVLVCVVGVPTLFRVLDVITAAPNRARIRASVEATACPSCEEHLGPSARWRVSGANHEVRCASCNATCTFDRRGVLQRRDVSASRPA